MYDGLNRPWNVANHYGMISLSTRNSFHSCLAGGLVHRLTCDFLILGKNSDFVSDDCLARTLF